MEGKKWGQGYAWKGGSQMVKAMTHRWIRVQKKYWLCEIHRYKIKKSNFIELFFLAPFLRLWQKAYSQNFFYL